MIRVRISKISAILLASLLLMSCQQKNAPIETHDSVLVFGTFVEVTLVNVSKNDRELVLKHIEKELQYYHYAFHPWKAGPTGRINQLLAATGEFTANPSVVPLIQLSKKYYRESKGLFNPAIGQLIKLWGYHDEFPPESGPIPSDKDIRAILDQKPSMDDITVKGIRVTNHNPINKLDFGGIAKGYAVDTILKHIREMGVKNATINAGGDLKVIGKHGDKPWHIGIRDPRGEGVIAGLELKDNEAAFTSGDYERFFKLAGKRYHHILDPRTGQPARNSQSVTVINTDATLADAAATALFIAGPDKWLDIAKSMHIDQAMLVDRNGKVYITEALARRVKFEKPGLDITTVEIQ